MSVLINRDYASMTDEELLGFVRFADAFAELSLRYLGLITAKAAKFRDVYSLEREDLCQEGMVSLYRAAISYNPSLSASFRTYASVCIENRMLSVIRTHSTMANSPLNNFVSLDDLSVECADNISSPEFLTEKQEDFEAVLNQIHISLSDFERKVLALYLSGYKRAEVVNMLRITSKAFDNAIQRVRKKLKVKNHSKAGQKP